MTPQQRRWLASIQTWVVVMPYCQLFAIAVGAAAYFVLKGKDPSLPTQDLQLGSDLAGEASGDWFGHSVALSADGSRVAIGAIYNDGDAADAGQVRLYDWTGSQWTQVGSDLDGEASGDWFGCSVSLSADGGRVAIGAIYNDGDAVDAGHVRIYDVA